MSLGVVRVEWRKAKHGYRLEQRLGISEGAILGRQARGTYLVPKGPESVWYDRGLLDEPTVFEDLLLMHPSDEGALAFANRWGLLTQEGDKTLDLIRESNRFRAAAIYADEHGLLKMAKCYSIDRLTPIKIRIGRAPRQAPGVFFYAKDLRTFCWLEMLQVVSGGTDLVRCERCQTLFRRPGTGPKPRFCSNACKQAVWRRENASRGRAG